MVTIEDAILLATESHRGQTDKAGLPYILHPLRVMAGFLTGENGDEETRMAAVLHDVVEDSDVTCQMLAERGYPCVVVEAVDALSRRAGERYGAYIERLAANPLAVRVKLADLSDNLSPWRPSTKELSQDMVHRYGVAQSYLRGLSGRRAADEELRSL